MHQEKLHKYGNKKSLIGLMLEKSSCGLIEVSNIVSRT